MIRKLILAAAAVTLAAFISAASVGAQQWDKSTMMTFSKAEEQPPRGALTVLPVLGVGLASITAAFALLVVSQRTKAVSLRIR